MIDVLLDNWNGRANTLECPKGRARRSVGLVAGNAFANGSEGSAVMTLMTVPLSPAAREGRA